MLTYKSVLLALFFASLANATPKERKTNTKEFPRKINLRNGQEVTIRLIRDEDINESANIIREAYLDDCQKIKHATSKQRDEMRNVPEDTTRLALRNFKAEKDSVLFVAEAEGNSGGTELKGCIRVKLNLTGNRKNDGPFAQIGPFATKLNCHGTGIGRAMISAAEDYATDNWKVCETHLDAHGIPEPKKGAFHESPPLLQFYEKRGYQRIGKTTWFDPETANYVKIEGSLCHLERMVKNTCLASEKDAKADKEKRKAPAEGESSSPKRRKMQMESSSSSKELIRNYALDAVKEQGDEIDTLAEDIVDFAHDMGLIKRLEDDESRKRRFSIVASIQPISLFPSPFPRSVYQQAMDVHRGMQKLYFRVCCDYEFLANASEQMVKTNELYGRMVKMMEQIQREGIKQPYQLFLTRSDYMVDNEQNGPQQKFGLKQIEMNIGSVVGSAMGARTSEVHRRMLKKVGLDETNVPENKAYNTLARGLFQAWLHFGDPNAVVVFAVLQGSVHRFDERTIEYELQRISDYQVQVVRMSSKDAYSKLFLDAQFDLRLSSDNRRVALVYSRSGPLPEWTEQEWQARLTIERSTAIKTSTMFSALSCSKRIQQLLAQPGMVERFLPEKEEQETVKAIRRTFVGLWGLENDDNETRQLVQSAIENPSLYVLKPQNEGGGHNYFDAQLQEKLQKFTHEERAAHTLMQRINPVTIKNYFVRPTDEKPVLDDVVVELGMFGYLLGNRSDQSIVKNEQHGYLVRTKLASSAEGGITAGGVYDSLNLF